MPIKRETAVARFWSEYTVTETGCWVRKGKRKNKYAVVRFGGKEMYAHRLAWELVHGLIPVGFHVLHNCDNPPCINPHDPEHHLHLGTRSDNLREASERGRFPRRDGERGYNAKLTGEQALWIRQSTLSLNELAKMFEVHRSTVDAIRKGKAWKDPEYQLTVVLT